MGGFAGLTSLTFFISLFLTSMMAFYQINYYSASQSYGLIRDLFELDLRIKDEAVRIDSLIKDSSRVYLNITNIGSSSIAVEDFKRCDLFIEYYRLSDGNRTAVWLPYSNTPSRGSWYIIAVYNEGVKGEGINPINTTSSQGHWDPNETLFIVGEIPESLIDRSKSVNVVFSTPLASLAKKVR
ncbi:MAG: hypothetical protein RMJ31_00650 [Nitrososphaerota archaeon]|nr:hypothetical protein [Nitrososphaerales archaeon]MDW8044272.1 hypothetical protein [Nitrososphaerota archaeon]